MVLLLPVLENQKALVLLLPRVRLATCPNTPLMGIRMVYFSSSRSLSATLPCFLFFVVRCLPRKLVMLGRRPLCELCVLFPRPPVSPLQSLPRLPRGKSLVSPFSLYGETQGWSHPFPVACCFTLFYPSFPGIVYPLGLWSWKRRRFVRLPI